MTRLELIQKIQNRKKQINISIENLAKLSNLGVRTVNRFFAGDDVKFSTIEKITMHISEYSDSNAGVQPDTFAMRFSRL